MVPAGDITMPTYNVQLNVNPPGVGSLNVPQTGIVAPNACAAIDIAKANIIIRVLQIQETSQQP